METTAKQSITIEITINAPVEKVWEYWTKAEHIVNWNNASDDWFTPHAVNDLRVGGGFLARMEARDGSMGFDFSGKYDVVDEHKQINYSLGDGRRVQISFSEEANATKMVETFDAEDSNSIDMQKGGWQAILDNFKKYVEEKKG